ncbi:hypothetical protein GVO57_08800 [Sphingomonas changnyeongensis]|uniref:Uncharacterized protein n=1 Tax=Sphingomonas changnyeongensis TaxID=2698679 RepID=A0A7Z2S9M1_9SPHN|nr:hypothetical protein [Sphingomonas changnyeongensis]QHL90899.1 hypothetical protein GVO57_08800 [Sphingomonas changnyeongensis]
MTERQFRPSRRFAGAARTRFLDALAGCATVRDAARAAGVSADTVYRHRLRDAGFRADWARAIDQAYARIEAELIGDAAAALTGVAAAAPEDGLPAHVVPSSDKLVWDRALQLLRLHRTGARVDSDAAGQKGSTMPVEEARARLLARLAAMGLIGRAD